MRITHTVLIVALFLSGYTMAVCGDDEVASPRSPADAPMSIATVPPPVHTPGPTQTAVATGVAEFPSPENIPSPTAQQTATTSTLTKSPPTATPRPPLDLTVTWEDATLELRYFGWKTDFTKSSVPYSEIKRGGPPRDGITPIDRPVFETVSEASAYMMDHEPVLSVELEGEVRAYPLAVLIWHEIVNDVLGGRPITVTYCPLCNTAIVFDRQVGEEKRLLDFGTTGYLRHSDMVMWDRQTESWWQQITGEAIVGEYTGTRLVFIPAGLVSWQDFRDSHPDGSVLSRNTGYPHNYSRPPYSGYDSGSDRPFMFVGELDDTLPPTERVVGLKMGETAVAFPFSLFKESYVINDSIEDTEIAIFYAPDTLSPFLGMFGAASPVVGSTGVFSPVLDGRKLTFRSEDHTIVDEQTGSTWNIFGEAIEGPLTGSVLEPVVHGNHFWFAWHVFYPDTLVRGRSEHTE